jgi:hypothetical protein
MAEDDNHDPECHFDGDVVMPIEPLSDGGAVCFVHTKDHRISVGELHPIRSGVPVPDEARFVECKDGRWTIHESVAEFKGGHGPTQVATDGYRESWERTFGKQRVGLA